MSPKLKKVLVVAAYAAAGAILQAYLPSELADPIKAFLDENLSVVLAIVGAAHAALPEVGKK